MNLFVSLAVRALEAIFVVGCVGSLLVVILAGLEDFRTVLRNGDTNTH